VGLPGLERDVRVRESSLEALAAGARAASAAPAEAMAAFARAAGIAARADVAVVRELDVGGDQLVARAVYAVSAADAALREGSRIPRSDLGTQTDELVHIPIERAGHVLGSLEVRRTGGAFTPEDLLSARLAAAQLAFVIQPQSSPSDNGELGRGLALAGDALAAASAEERTPAHVVRVAAVAAHARAAYLWHTDGTLTASFGSADAELGVLGRAAAAVLESREFVAIEVWNEQMLVSVRLGDPPRGVLQLVLDPGTTPDADALGTFALRAGEALRASDRARSTSLALHRTRELLAAVGQANSQLSLAHALATAVDRVAQLLRENRVAVYLRERGRLVAAAGRGLAGPHTVVADALVELMLGPYRGRSVIVVDEVAGEPRLADAHDAAREAGIEAVIALPLAVRGETIGLLAVYPDGEREVTEDEQSLLAALAAQLAVAVQNARLHEDVAEARRELQNAFDAEKESARRLRALYDVSRSFAELLSVDETLQALARNAAELLDMDAAVLRLPDARRELLTAHALHVRDDRLDAPLRTLLALPQSFSALPIQRLFRTRRPIRLDAQVARALGGSNELLVPFLEKGSTGAVLPVATPAEVIATLTIVSFDPARRVTRDVIDNALSIAAQAALAIDNGRLYQQQKQFADTMQRSLLPRSHPRLPGLEIGEVYESSARVDVGGDVYDFLELGDGRLAVVLGDVTGHGIEATADMAMAKFVFRSLAREHPEPGDFLAAANEVVVDEIAPAKFITMTYVTASAETGEVSVASAGHPAPLVVSADGEVHPVEVRGLALGVDVDQTYESATTTLGTGSSLVLFTDGVIEARNGTELYGNDRLAATLARWSHLPPRELALAVVRDCRAFGGGELLDDCAVVVIRRVEPPTG
jgi:serine phosphatase RsbU (regulator of sigma subunit)